MYIDTISKTYVAFWKILCAKLFLFSWDLIFAFCHFSQCVVIFGKKACLSPKNLFFFLNVFWKEWYIRTYVLHLCKCSGNEARNGVFLYLRSKFWGNVFAVDSPQWCKTLYVHRYIHTSPIFVMKSAGCQWTHQYIKVNYTAWFFGIIDTMSKIYVVVRKFLFCSWDFIFVFFCNLLGLLFDQKYMFAQNKNLQSVV